MTIENYNSVSLANKSLLCVFCKQKSSINAEMMNHKLSHNVHEIPKKFSQLIRGSSQNGVVSDLGGYQFF